MKKKHSHPEVLDLPAEDMGESKTRIHKSVLVSQVVHYLAPKPQGIYLDVTFGSGGHTRALLEKEPTCSVIALDWDAQSLETYGQPLQEQFGDRIRLVWGNFALLYMLAKKEKIPAVDGILADFGTSQMQLLDRPGFSFSRDSVLDMRMSPAHQQVTAAHVLATSPERKLYEIFAQLGEERYAKQIAQAIVIARRKKPIVTTKQLADLVETIVLPYSRKTHPATKVFQALRLYVNRELNNISSFLPTALELLVPGGRLVCISFHSLEDRLVKDFFHEQEQAGTVTVLTSKVVVADEQEVKNNPSARSAKLRATQKNS
jgi:16S rRNA (cytosine1402-N4)-methyltransferase